MSSREKVYVAECSDYDVGRIRSIIARATAELGFAARGKVFAKPNVVFAFEPERYGRHSFTGPAVVEAALAHLAATSGVSRVDLGEKSGMGVPTRLGFRHAGYFDIVDRVGAASSVPVAAVCMEEHPRTEVFVGGKVHDRIRLNRQMAAADTLVALPKLKCHCVSKMTAAVKLNIGILCDDERAIRHDFLLNDKIADLLAPADPDLVVTDAIEVGVGNEVLPIPRKLGLLIISRSALAADIVSAQLLGLEAIEIDHLRELFDRGYHPATNAEIELCGDITSWDGIAAAARRLEPYDDEFYQWQDVPKELRRLGSPLELCHGPYCAGKPDLCNTGCLMGLKMFLAVLERFSGADVFAAGRAQKIVIGRIDEPVDGGGEIVWMFGSCARAEVVNAAEVVRVDKCFSTATDMFLATGSRMGVSNPFRDPKILKHFVPAAARASVAKVASGRYLEDVRHFVSQHLTRRV